MESNQSKQIKILQRMLEEQMQTNQLLLLLIEALSEEGGNEDQEPQTYMDGTPV